MLYRFTQRDRASRAARLICLVVLCGGSGRAIAHEKEPINTEFAPPVEAPIFQLTASRFANESGAWFTVPAVSLEAPITPGMQFEVGIPILRNQPDRGPATTSLGDLDLGFRYQFLPEHRQGTRPDVDLNFELSLPTGDRSAGLGGEAWEASLGLFLTKYLARSILFGNFSYAAEIPRNNDAERENHFELATAVVYSVSRHVHPAFELFGGRNLTAETTELYLTPEIIFTLSHGWEVKAAVPLGVTGRSDDFGVQIQLCYLMHSARHVRDDH